ncbi:hypothetical protein O3S80_34220, partial [Streptomyces sp. Lzd4kr]|nr:hypothetical protein [Streptomyces sp. Lzd4kr]
MQTERGETYVRPSEEQLSGLVHRLGRRGDHWLVTQRIPDVPDVFAQVWHKRGGDYQLEHRESRERFVAGPSRTPRRWPARWWGGPGGGAA